LASNRKKLIRHTDDGLASIPAQKLRIIISAKRQLIRSLDSNDASVAAGLKKALQVLLK
jgi:hypothetical protein